MKEKYNHLKIEPRWQKIWQKQNLYRAKDFSKKPKYYVLVEFPYPSGDGLHIGHCRSYSALDTLARKRRMEGFNVLYPIGWDAFGLPAENYALRTGQHPQETVAKNIKQFRKQCQSMGFSFDWSREINTTDPAYYKWTQWIFLKLFEKDLAYQDEIPINWCPSCKIGLANEEVIAGKCERCGTKTVHKMKKQWMFKITAYADQLIDDLEKVDYLPKITKQQQNWIGRSYGAEIEFRIKNEKLRVKVFTTRPDTLFGVTGLVIAPEHKIIKRLESRIKNLAEVKTYIRKAEQKSELERTSLEKEKTGVEIKGIKAINPANGQEVPVWVGDYVKAKYGGGAVMVVPAHDKRDYAFAKKYGLQIREVISGGDISKQAFVDYGKLVNSGQFNDLFSKEAIKKITQWLEDKGFGKKKVSYKLRDWVFSRQHYWGEPIPIIYCQKCGIVPVPEKDLPIELPFVKKYQPTQTGESPLAAIKDWLNTKCPKCHGPAKRETDTMPNWAGSNWYFIRYCDPKNNRVLASRKKLDYWLPVDVYNGGMEHTTLHLLYSRFIYKVLSGINVVPGHEPYKHRHSHGMVLAPDGRKMSKSLGNVINPDEIIEKYGADSLRLYEMFMGPFEEAIAWDPKGIIGLRRFLAKIKTRINSGIQAGSPDSSGDQIGQRLTHKTIKKVTEDIERFRFNTAISCLMEYVNSGEYDYETLLKLLAPFAPHITEELWKKLGHRESIFRQKWPQYDPKLVKEEKIELVIQVNGRVRDRVTIATDISEKKAKNIALAREKIKKWLKAKRIKKTVFVTNKLINFVVYDRDKEN